ncbi:MAG: hypothetical protein FRX48_00863 [Lasallia pustulata]|uniref:Uncharacterized protein n=1 Tax=Lasallia pustulata TaxID=136370 RepID=A0A5M8Q1R8_9LECA|nr:MAG: hypothetical protein FRX48_00863 [Lasallia pustulata]
MGSAGAPPISYATGLSSGVLPRRSSYASVAAGTASAASPQTQPPPAVAGAFSHLINANPLSPMYAQNHQAEHNSHTSHRAFDSGTRDSDGTTIPGSWGKGVGMAAHSSPYAYGGNHGLLGGIGTSTNGFFRPSYLRESKYMERLEAAHKAKVAAQREASSAHSSAPGSLSTSSSSVSLHRMAPSHRGMTYEIVEHQPLVDDDGLTPLPSRWAEADKYGGLEIAGDGLEVRYTGLSKTHEHEAPATRADHPMPPQCGIYYYEVTIVAKGKEGMIGSMIGVGFSGSKASLERLPGWEPDSWAYHGDDGKSFAGESTGKSYGPTFTTGDVVGCGVNFMTKTAFFTKNGVFLGNAFRHLTDVKVYPSIGMKRPGAQLSVNFGQRPFVFDIDGIMAREKLSIGEEVSSVDVAKLHPPLSETALIQELVAQFLAHDGYVETAKAFTEEVRSEANALKPGQDTLIDSLDMGEDLDAVNRQGIRAAILDGDIDKALKHTNAYYPHVLQNNPQIYFRLRCRKFIEMIRQCTELLAGSAGKGNKSTNGNYMDIYDDVFEHDMELVDQVNNGDDWDKMETEEADHSRYQSLMSDTLQYGQELRIEFKEDRSKEVNDALAEIFSLFAYEDPRKSTTAPLLDQTGRVPVAEELNSAILVSLGKSSSAAIERLYQQAEVLVGDISDDGGAGAFINVRNDFLR